MEEDRFERAKIISRPGDTNTEAADPEVSVKATDGDSVIAATANPEPDAGFKTDGDSWDGIMDRFTGKKGGNIVWASPYAMYENGVFRGLYKATVDQVAVAIKGIAITTVFHAYLLIGYYLLAVYFDSDESVAFSRNPYKDTSINDLAKKDEIPFTRGKLTDCIKTAAVDMELNKHGFHPQHLHWEHLLQLARLRKQDQRLELALRAEEQKLTSNELKKVIDKMLGKTTSQDKQIGRALIRQLREFVRLTSDDDVQAFLEDKDRSAVLDHTEIAQLLEFSGKFRSAAEESEETLKQFEENLRQNFLEKETQKLLSSGKDHKTLID